MLKLSKAQATAVAKKIRERAESTRQQNVDAYKKELIGSKEYKQMETEAIALLPLMGAILEHAPKDNSCYIAFNAFGHSTYLHRNDTANWKDSILKNWVDCMANEKYPYSYIREEELVSDIIFESIVSDDINELIDKFASRYGQNNA